MWSRLLLCSDDHDDRDMVENGAVGTYAYVDGQKDFTPTPVIDVKEGWITKWHDTGWPDARDTGKICAYMTVSQFEDEKPKPTPCVPSTKTWRYQGAKVPARVANIMHRASHTLSDTPV